MSRITVGPAGSIIKGHVLDCAAAPVERALRAHDAQLYVKWNPRKLHGHGVWEVRRRPDTKSVLPEDVIVFKKNTFVFPKYHELDIVNHVLDVPFLNYNVVSKIKSMDAWSEKFGERGKNFAKEAEYIEAKYDEKTEDDFLKEREYNLKQMKSEIRWLKEYVASGGNPARIADYWK